ncbi:MAG: transporter [Curvibacter sp. PD_MW3]|nr:TolC family protein [Burkholderiales bacterium]PHM19851.1 MAG: transporter [Curvibacter sp. PD_MW3]
MKKKNKHLLARVALAMAFAHPAASQAQPLSFESAWQRLLSGSDKLAAAQSAVDSKRLQGEGLKGLGGPVVSVTGASYVYNANLNINLDPVNQGIAQATQSLPAPLKNVPISVSPLPSQYIYNRHESATNASVSAIWPIYAGGAADSMRGFVKAQGDEAQADAARTSHELATLLAQRYFGAQLAVRAARLRAAARDNVARHDSTAERLLAAGLISRIERLQAQSAYEEAKRNALKAQDDADMAMLALARTIKVAGPVEALSPLFVISQPLEPLPHFTDAALRLHPGLDKVAAKKAQAEQLHEGEEAMRRPQVFAFGQHQIKSDNPDWVAGIGVRWTLWDAVNRDTLAAASLKQVEQAERTDAQARNDIALLVEKNWRALENARRQFLGQQTSAELAAEVLRLRTAALREGTGTALELIDAETNMAKVQTERAQAAYEYVMALANLLESCGLSEEFSAYMARADVRVE